MTTFDIETQGLDTLLDLFQNLPEEALRAADDAGAEARPVILRSIQAATPVRTGFLRDSEDVVVLDHFLIQAEATAPYAQFVDARTGFMQRGIDDAQAEVEAIYDAAIDRLVEGL